MEEHIVPLLKLIIWTSVLAALLMKMYGGDNDK